MNLRHFRPWPRGKGEDCCWSIWLRNVQMYHGAVPLNIRKEEDIVLSSEINYFENMLPKMVFRHLVVVFLVATNHGCYGHETSPQEHHQSHYASYKRNTELSREMDLRNHMVAQQQQQQQQQQPVRSPRRSKRQSQPQPVTITIACGNDDILGNCDANSRYRTISGRCNNLKHPSWGASNIAFRRFVPPAYADGLGVPRGGFENEDNRVNPTDITDCTKEDPGRPLPNARRISTRFHPEKVVSSSRLTHMTALFGQFLDHDLTFTPESSLAEDCCGNPLSSECFTIAVPEDDYYFAGSSNKKTCIDFGRSSSFCLDPEKPREQMNALTAFLDCSHTYGSTEQESITLRTFSDGLLRSSFRGQNARELLASSSSTPGFFLTGDVRGTEMPDLAAMHTVFIREHNRIARQLKAKNINDTFDDEELFQRARSIVIAEWQNIVYSEYLPVILGGASNASSVKDKQSLYDPRVDPSISNGFATAAFRFGHTLIQGLVHMVSSSGEKSTSIGNSSYHVKDNFFSMGRYMEDDGRGLESILRGLAAQPAAESDRFVTAEVTNTLLPGVDLVARNIQRGRDHGLPGYNEFRQFCGMERICSWDDVPAEMSGSNWNLLSQIYEHPNDIDLFPAGIAEDSFEEGVLGRTFACMIDKTFGALKDGDRFFFTHQRGVATWDRAQLRSIKKRTLRDLLCENGDMEHLQENVFLLEGDVKSCRNTSRLNFDLFV